MRGMKADKSSTYSQVSNFTNKLVLFKFRWTDKDKRLECLKYIIVENTISWISYLVGDVYTRNENNLLRYEQFQLLYQTCCENVIKSMAQLAIFQLQILQIANFCIHYSWKNTIFANNKIYEMFFWNKNRCRLCLSFVQIELSIKKWLSWNIDLAKNKYLVFQFSICLEIGRLKQRTRTIVYCNFSIQDDSIHLIYLKTKCLSITLWLSTCLWINPHTFYLQAAIPVT